MSETIDLPAGCICYVCIFLCVFGAFWSGHFIHFSQHRETNRTDKNIYPQMKLCK